MSEFIMLNGIESINMFGKQLGFKKQWASFPFHPHKGDPNTNRAPTNQELEIGRPYLKNLIEIFEIQNIIAVGNKAEQTLGLMGVKAPKVRHPSHGGKTEFVLGVDKYIV